MATGPIETHLHRSFKWENDAPGTFGGRGGIRLAAGTAYLPNVFGLLLPRGEEEARLHRDAARPSRLPRREPKTFDGYDFTRIQGRVRPRWASSRRWSTSTRTATSPSSGPGTSERRTSRRPTGASAACGVPEGRPAGKHVAGRLLARQAVVPHRGRGGQMRLRQAVHRPVLRRRRQALREGGAERDDPHEQHRPERVGRVLHWGRHAPLRPRQAVRQGVDVRDAGPELPRQGARHLLGGGRPPGCEGEGDPARGDVGKR